MGGSGNGEDPHFPPPGAPGANPAAAVGECGMPDLSPPLPVLESERLRLRPMRAGDVDDVFALYS